MQIKKLQFILIFVITISLLIEPVSSNKIQKGDVWQYTDSTNVNYDESSFDIIQLINGDDVIATSIVNTSRPFVQDYGRSASGELPGASFSFEYDLDFGEGPIYLTQESGMPLYAARPILGSIELTAFSNFSTELGFEISVTRNSEFSIDLNPTNWYCKDFQWEVSGDPALALSTTNSIRYSVQAYYTGTDNPTCGSDEGGWVNDPTSISYQYGYGVEYIISSNDDIDAITKEFTFTRLSEVSEVTVRNSTDTVHMVITEENGRINYQRFHEISNRTGDPPGWLGYGWWPEFDGGETTSDGFAMLVRIENGFNIPTYIKQTEPARIGSLKLSQTDELVEYFLIKENDLGTSSNSTSLGNSDTSDDGSLPFPNMLFVLPILLLFKKKYK